MVVTDDIVNGEFRCEFNDSNIGPWKRANTSVSHKPELTRITGYSGNKTIKETSSLTLFCNTTGKPTANITWTRVLDDGSDGKKMFVGNPWIITSIKRTMNGTYRCTACNGFGNAVTSSVHVNITHKYANVHVKNLFLAITNLGKSVLIANNVEMWLKLSGKCR